MRDHSIMTDAIHTASLALTLTLYKTKPSRRPYMQLAVCIDTLFHFTH